MAEDEVRIIEGRFTPTPSERAALAGSRAKAMRERVKSAVWLGVIFLFLLADVVWRVGRPQWAFLVAWSLYAATIAFGLALKMRTPLPDDFADAANIDVQVSDRGITFGPRRERIPWPSIAYVRDHGDAFEFVTRATRGRAECEYLIPKRSFADGGTTLWALANERLTGTYHLVRSTHNRNLISNTRTSWST